MAGSPPAAVATGLPLVRRFVVCGQDLKRQQAGLEPSLPITELLREHRGYIELSEEVYAVSAEAAGRR